MKAVILCLALFVAVVTSERCSFSHHECSSVSCSAGTPHCVLGTCTCTTNTGKACTAGSDCDGHCLLHRPQHCVDGHCHCAFDSLIGGLGGLGGGHA
ncbi:serine protease inhibitor Cvsi-2-like [Ostrea edulis]|uniref:serine protease inhibitor Cvsi-2-like n=1 Tax=Ostrea edulis TaxID=37623 RepID=UPI0024AF9DDD|nr:serine protease inhibitor Cvsi-2-like [Ostrea edulis]